MTGKILRVVIHVVMILGGAVLGFQAGLRFFYALRDGDFVRWRRLPDPPYPVTALLTATAHSLYVQTAQGIYHAADIQVCLDSHKRGCWQKVDRPGIDPPVGYACPVEESGSRFHIAAPPVAAAENLTESECGGEWSNETYYLQDGNGTVWVWLWGDFSMALIGDFLLIAVGGAMAGALTGEVIAFMLIKASKWVRAHRQGAAPG